MPTSATSKPAASTKSEKLDEKAVKKILRGLDRIRKRLEVGEFLDTRALCDDTASVAATLRYVGKTKVSLHLAPMGKWADTQLEPLKERAPNTLPKQSVKTTIMTEEEIMEIFGEEIVQDIRDKKGEKARKKAIEEKTNKILSGNAKWDEDDADALAWDT